MKVPYDVVLPQVSVLDSTMALPGKRETRTRRVAPFFLHGEPDPRRTYGGMSFPWLHRQRIASHRISSGFGQSGKPDIEYRFADHVRYLDAFLANAGISSAFVIAHDWGNRAGIFTWQPAGRSLSVGLLLWSSSGQCLPGRIFLRQYAKTFQKFRTPGMGEKMILEDNAFVEGVLPGANRTKN